MVKIGQGNITSGGNCQGVLRVVESVEDVLRLMKEDISATILLTPTASATIMTPLFPRIKGVVCTTGGPTSHVAIVAREFDLACIMGAQFDFHGDLDGCAVSLNAEGEIFTES
jgi:phosphohistidine swiveling domain-containing protein